MSINFLELPEEIITKIINNLDESDLYSVNQTCKTMYRIGNEMLNNRMKSFMFRKMQILSPEFKSTESLEPWINKLFFSRKMKYELVEIKNLKCTADKQALIELLNLSTFLCSRLILNSKTLFDCIFIKKTLTFFENISQLELNSTKNLLLLKFCTNLIYLKLNCDVCDIGLIRLNNLKYVDCKITRKCDVSSILNLLHVDNILLRINDQCLKFSKSIKVLTKLQKLNFKSVAIVFNLKCNLNSKWFELIDLIENLKTLNLNVSFNSKEPIHCNFDLTCNSIHLDKNTTLSHYKTNKILFKNDVLDSVSIDICKKLNLQNLYISSTNLVTIKQILNYNKNLINLVVFLDDVNSIFLNNLYNLIHEIDFNHKINILLCESSIIYKFQIIENDKLKMQSINYNYDLLNRDCMLLPFFIF